MTTTEYIWDMQNDSYLMEQDGNGATTAAYTVAPTRFGKVVSQNRSATTSFYHYDGQGSTRTLTDQNQNVTDTVNYSAFGGRVAGSTLTTNPFKYDGAVAYYNDSETSDVYVRARTYATKAGRWLSTDPIGLLAGTNLYRFADCNPVSREDPSGLLTITPIAGDPVTKCGQRYSVEWNFLLDKNDAGHVAGMCPLPRGDSKILGYVVQHVFTICKVNPCNDCGKVTGFERFGYWEAWPIKLGAVGLPLDRASFVARDGHCGSHWQHARANFYCWDKTGDLGDVGRDAPPWISRKDAQFGKQCKTGTGGQPATKFWPTFTALPPDESGDFRYAFIEFNCCPCTTHSVLGARHPDKARDEGGERPISRTPRSEQ